MMRFLLTALLSSSLLACAEPAMVLNGGQDQEVTGPFAKGDGTDVSDHECRVILRSVDHTKVNLYAPVRFVVFKGRFDVAESELTGDRTSAHVMYRAGSEKRWQQVDATRVGGGSVGFQRFSFRLDYATLTPHDIEFQRDTMLIQPFVKTATGRLIDRNLLDEDAQSYVIGKPDFKYTAPQGTCTAPDRETVAPVTVAATAGPAAALVTVRTGTPTSDPCKDSVAYSETLTVHDYQTTSADSATHACILLEKPKNRADSWGEPETTEDEFDLRVHYRFARDGKFTQSSVDFDRTVGTKARYRLDLWELDPFPADGCPKGGVDLEHTEGDYDMWARVELYFTVGEGDENRTEIRPEGAEYFEARYGAFLSYNCLH